MLCPCGTNQNFDQCCAQYIQFLSRPHNAEQLMRSRYTAHYLFDISYIQKTMIKTALEHFDPIQTKKWLNRVRWISLRILNKQERELDESFVEFEAKYIENGYLKCIHERSRFERIEGQWFYVDGEYTPFQSKLILQNHSCPCGSFRKFKNCHGSKK